MTTLARARSACAIALIAGAAILATAASYGQDSPEKLAQQSGTAADAKAMLTKTVSALKADKAKTVDEINKEEGGFLHRASIHSASTSATQVVAVGSNNAKQFLGTDIRVPEGRNQQGVRPGTLRRG